jgi:hypothetical protein
MNKNHSPFEILLAGLLASLVVACTSDDAQRQTGVEWQVPRTVAALKVQGDADSLAAAAELTSKSDAQRLTLFTRAVALAPDRSDLVWLQLEACGRVESCDPTAIAATLHRLDPDNGAAWAPLLDRAIRDGDADATNGSLSAIASSKRFDIYWNQSIAYLSTAVVNVHTMDLSTARVSEPF